MLRKVVVRGLEFGLQFNLVLFQALHLALQPIPLKTRLLVLLHRLREPDIDAPALPEPVL